MLRTAIDSKAYISFRYLQARRIGPFFDPDVAFLEDVALFFQDQFPAAVALVVADTALADLLHIQGHFPGQAIDGLVATAALTGGESQAQIQEQQARRNGPKGMIVFPVRNR